MLRATAEASAALKGVADVDPVFMSVAEKEAALEALAVLDAQVAAERMAILAVAADVAEAHGARDVTAWVRSQARLDAGRPRADVVLAGDLGRLPVVAAALREGRVSQAQAREMCAGLREVPEGVDAEEIERAQVWLVEQAQAFGPRELKVLARKVFEVIAPDKADDHERKALEREERAARKRIHLTIRDAGDGTAYLRGRLSSADAARLKTYLHAFTSPRRTGAAAGDAAGGCDAEAERVPYDVRLGQAFAQFLECVDPARLPLHGGAATTVIVTMDLAALLRGVGVATTDAGTRITAGEARRLACTADLVPAVLGGASEVLDLGRSARLFSRAQRKALAVRDGGCRAEGCTVEASWCEAHHLTEWSRGGRSDLTNAVLLCGHHHRRIHDNRYLHSRLPSGDVRFARRR